MLPTAWVGLLCSCCCHAAAASHAAGVHCTWQAVQVGVLAGGWWLASGYNSGLGCRVSLYDVGVYVESCVDGLAPPAALLLLAMQVGKGARFVASDN